MFAERNLLESLGPQVLNEHESSCSAIGNVLCNVIDLFLVQSKFLIIGSLSSSICSNFSTLFASCTKTNKRSDAGRLILSGHYQKAG